MPILFSIFKSFIINPFVTVPGEFTTMFACNNKYCIVDNEHKKNKNKHDNNQKTRRRRAADIFVEW